MCRGRGRRFKNSLCAPLRPSAGNASPFESGSRLILHYLVHYFLPPARSSCGGACFQVVFFAACVAHCCVPPGEQPSKLNERRASTARVPNRSYVMEPQTPCRPVRPTAAQPRPVPRARGGGGWVPILAAADVSGLGGSDLEGSDREEIAHARQSYSSGLREE